MLDTGTIFCYNRDMKQVKKLPVRNFVAKDLRTPKYRLKVVELKTRYKRKAKTHNDYNLQYL